MTPSSAIFVYRRRKGTPNTMNPSISMPNKNVTARDYVKYIGALRKLKEKWNITEA